MYHPIKGFLEAICHFPGITFHVFQSSPPPPYFEIKSKYPNVGLIKLIHGSHLYDCAVNEVISIYNPFIGFPGGICHFPLITIHIWTFLQLPF